MAEELNLRKMRDPASVENAQQEEDFEIGNRGRHPGRGSEVREPLPKELVRRAWRLTSSKTTPTR
jgi:hypothetical protein